MANSVHGRLMAVERALSVANYSYSAMVAERDFAVEAVKQYAQHTDTRCAERGRWPWEPHCPCGLTKVMDALKIPVEP